MGGGAEGGPGGPGRADRRGVAVYLSRRRGSGTVYRMGKKTSVYLADSRLARIKADGGSLTDILDAGLDAREADRAGSLTARDAAQRAWPPLDQAVSQAQSDGEKIAEELMARAAAGDPGAQEAIGKLVPGHPLSSPLPPEARSARIMIPESGEPVTVPAGVTSAVFSTQCQCPHRNWGRFCVRCDALISDTGYPVLS